MHDGKCLTPLKEMFSILKRLPAVELKKAKTCCNYLFNYGVFGQIAVKSNKYYAG